MKTLLLIPIIAALVACGNKPDTCEDELTKKSVVNMFYGEANVSKTTFNADFRSVFTHSVNDAGEHQCSAKVYFMLNDQSKSTWASASKKLEDSVKLTPVGFPVTEYLPPRANSAAWFAWFAGSAAENHYSTLMHLAPTKFFPLMANYMKSMGNESHPEHLVFYAYENEMNELYSSALEANANYQKYISQEIEVELFYDTKVIQHNSKMKDIL